jgi:hypothetical protein
MLQRRDGRVVEEPLPSALECLTGALAASVPGREGDWAAEVSGALSGLALALGQHTATAEGADGRLAQIDLTRPTLVRRVSVLRREHFEFFEQVRELRTQIESVAEAFRLVAQPIGEAGALPAPAEPALVPDFGALRQQVEQLVAALQHHHEEEIDLALESVATDIGVGD